MGSSKAVCAGDLNSFRAAELRGTAAAAAVVLQRRFHLGALPSFLGICQQCSHGSFPDWRTGNLSDSRGCRGGSEICDQ